MKKSFLLFLILPSLCSCNNKTSNSNKIEMQDTLSLKQTEAIDTTTNNQSTRESLAPYFKEDRTGDRSWIQVKNALSDKQTGIYVYFQTEYDVAKNLRMRIQYDDNSSYKFIIDGKTYTYKANRSKNADVRFTDGGYNWYDSNVKKKDLEFLEALADSQNAILTLNNGTSITISNQTKLNIKRTLEYFELLDGLLPKTNMVNIRRI